VKQIYLDGKGVRFCQDINDYLFRKIEELKPRVLVLAAQWWEVPRNDLDRLDQTVGRLKNAVVQNIIVVGPVPVWNPPLPKLLLKFYQTSVPKHAPDRMSGATLFTDIEKKLQKIAAKKASGLLRQTMYFVGKMNV